jgi:hypothetical protein
MFEEISLFDIPPIRDETTQYIVQLNTWPNEDCISLHELDIVAFFRKSTQKTASFIFPKAKDLQPHPSRWMWLFSY